MKKIILKKDKEYPILNKHPWIFSGAIASVDSIEDGDFAEIYSQNKTLLGHAYYNKHSDIACRMINFNTEDPILTLKKNILNAVEFRESYFSKSTNCYRLINGEGDFVPGLVIDKYDDILVLQSSTCGIDKHKSLIVDELINHYGKNISIYEKSSNNSRTKEKLNELIGFIYGSKSEVEVLENGIKFFVDVCDSQKTGLFLDMREMRNFIRKISNNKKVLNCFSYTGGFSLYAASNNALEVTSVDVSTSALETANLNFKINNFIDDKKYFFYAEDVFSFIANNSLEYDIIILDPPAFAKGRKDLNNAKNAYYRLNKTVLEKLSSPTILLTCSCSYYLSYSDFEQVLKKAIFDTGKTAKIISKHILSSDHTLNFHQSEFDYLKSITLEVY